MFVYWCIFLAAAAGVALSHPNPDPHKRLGPLGLFLFAIMILVGLRFEVGADWPIYQILYANAKHAKLAYVIQHQEPGFGIINWLAAQFDLGVWVINLTCAALFSWGLARFARLQPDPWLTIVAAIPYLIIVVAMGYTRQAVAIGLILAGLASFFRRPSLVRFACYVAVAALFHRTAVAAFPLVALSNSRNRLANFLLAIAFAYLLWDLFLADSMEHYIQNYVDAGYSSQGAAIRMAMSALSAAVLFAAGRRLGFSEIELRVWRNFSIVTIGLVVALGISSSSTAVDRLALYVLPLQLAVLGRLPALASNWRSWRIGVVAGEAFVLFTWLMFALHARYWLPYRFYPLERWG